MCNNHKKTHYHGSSIEHGEAHTHDHQNWNRRQFLSMGGLFAAGSLMLRRTPITSLLPNALTNSLANAGSDNILVLIRLFGGNDGLNTIIPVTMDVGRSEYETFRPNMKLSLNNGFGSNQILTNGYNHTLGINSNGRFAMPIQMDPLMNLWNNGNMSVIHNVGYESANLSHFVSTDYWSSGTNQSSNNLYESGWMGRYVDGEFPTFAGNPPSAPPAILIGNSSDLTFINPGGENMALIFTDVTEFNNLIANGVPHTNITITGNCAVDRERRFLRDIANNGYVYNNSIQTAFSGGGTYSYSTGTELSNKLNIIARLIKGGLDTRIYMVTLDGFDFHVGQMGNHQNLLGDLATSFSDFYADLSSTGHQEKVLSMAYSEFGRTIVDNGSGTDHGSLNNVMFFGEGLSGGFHGTPMNLADPAIPWQHRVTFESTYQKPTDFRDIYTTILQDWLCVNPTIGFPSQTFKRIPALIENPCVCDTSCPPVAVLNNGTDDFPVNQSATILVGNTITADNVVNNGSNVTYDAGNYIDLHPHFEVKQGAEFHAKIQGCTPFAGQDPTKINTDKSDKNKKK